MRRHIWIVFAGAAVLLAGAAIAVWRPWQAAGAPETAEIAAGRTLAETCTVCHALDRGAPPRVGPHLWQIVGRPVGGVAGFGYSPAMARAGGVWTADRLDAFLADPAHAFPGTTMVYPGLADADDRIRMIAFLRTLRD